MTNNTLRRKPKPRSATNSSSPQPAKARPEKLAEAVKELLGEAPGEGQYGGKKSGPGR